jgi:hypothetical protein
MSACGRVMLGMETGCSHDGCWAVAGALQVRLRPYGGLDGVGVVRRDKRPDEAAYVEDQRLPFAWPAGVQARPVAGVGGAPDPSPASRGAEVDAPVSADRPVGNPLGAPWEVIATDADLIRCAFDPPVPVHEQHFSWPGPPFRHGISEPLPGSTYEPGCGGCIFL